MQIKKRDGTFNMYSLELSFGELVATMSALDDVTSGGPVVDEMVAGLKWYLDNLPGPGEDKEDFKAKKEAEKDAKNGELDQPLDGDTAGGIPQPPAPGEDEPRLNLNQDADSVLPEPPAE